ncbi:MAG: hypothetical protein Q4G27_07945 [Flavobacteriaceae bacterium]|nr:hypothetical protein [Flavobacteriaceae bacterium]
MQYSYYQKNDKSLVIIPNIHVAVEEQFNDLKFKIDSLTQQGYFLYYEGVNVHITDTTTILKANKITGIENTKGLKTQFDKIIKNPKGRMQRLIMQPKFTSLGATEENSKNMDLTMREVVDKYEEKFGEIILNDCDYASFNNEDIKCKKSPDVPRENSKYAMTEIRDQYIVNQIIKEGKDKVVMVYGKEHYKGMHPLFIENGYQLIDSLK